MLDVYRRDDVDAGGEHLVDVLPALLVARLGKVRMGELVDQRELGRAAEDGVDVHLLEVEAAVAGAQVRDLLDALSERSGLGALVRLEVADDDVPALGVRRPALLQHPVGLADTGGHSEQDPVVAAQATGPYAPNRLCTTRSISLIPMKGRIMPPRP